MYLHVSFSVGYIYHYIYIFLLGIFTIISIFFCWVYLALYFLLGIFTIISTGILLLGIFTIISISSCKFLQVAANVSDVPNSKYHSLFFILKNKVSHDMRKPVFGVPTRSDTN